MRFNDLGVEIIFICMLLQKSNKISIGVGLAINFHIVIIRTLPYRIQMKVKPVSDST